MIQAALLGGLFVGVLSALPIINVANCCCLWIVTGGLLAAHLAQEADPRAIGIGRAALAGLLAGVVGAFVWMAATGLVSVFVGPLQERMVAAMVRSARDMPPDVREWFDRVGVRASSPLRLLVGFFFQLSAGVICGTFGGIIGGALFSRDRMPLREDIPPPLP